LSALFFGGLMMAFPIDTPLGIGAILPYVQAFPFPQQFIQDMFWSGVALACCNGIVNIAAMIAGLRKLPITPILSLIAGILLVAWCSFEIVYMPNLASIFYAIIGFLQIVLSGLIIQKTRA
jgi:hypothetical protein